MGAKDNGPVGAEAKPNGAAKDSGRTDTESTRKSEAGGSGRRSTTAKGSAEKAKPIKVSVGIEETPAEPDKGKKQGVSKRTQQRRAAATKKEKDQHASNLKPHIAMVLVVTFDMTATKLGDHWRVTPEEAEKVAEPLSNILAEYIKASEKMEKYADWVGVIGALAMIVVPRLLMQKAMSKKGGQQNARVQQPTNTKPVVTGTTGTNEGENVKSVRPVSSTPPASSSNGIKSLLAPTAAY